MRGNLRCEILKEAAECQGAAGRRQRGHDSRDRAGRADALVENVDFFLRFTKNYPDVKWRVLKDPIFVAYCGIGVKQGTTSLREFLNALIYDLHSSRRDRQRVEEVVRRTDGRASRVDPFF